MAILIHIDWISVTDKHPDPHLSSAHSILSDNGWKKTNAKNGYTLGQKHVTTVTEYKNLDRPDMGNHVIYSSKSLDRMLHMYDISGCELLQHHISEGHNVARLDLAIDFKGFGVTVGDFVDCFNRGAVKTKLRTATVISSLTGGGDTFYLGSMKKRKNLVRVYDKGKEQGTGDDWVRVELQIMGKKATSTGKIVSSSDDIESEIIGIIKGVVDFQGVSVWDLLTHDQLQVSMESESKKQGDTERWLMTQVIPALGRTVVLNIDFWIQFQIALLKKVGKEKWSEIENYQRPF